MNKTLAITDEAHRIIPNSTRDDATRSRRRPASPPPTSCDALETRTSSPGCEDPLRRRARTMERPGSKSGTKRALPRPPVRRERANSLESKTLTRLHDAGGPPKKQPTKHSTRLSSRGGRTSPSRSKARNRSCRGRPLLPTLSARRRSIRIRSACISACRTTQT